MFWSRSSVKNPYVARKGNRQRAAVFSIIILALLPAATLRCETPALIEVSTVLETEIVPQITLIGTAEPLLETVVASEEEGLVTRMLVEEGDRVEQKQHLCDQDTSQLRLTIETERAALAEAEILSRQTQREWDRQKRLFSIKSVSERAYENAQFEAEVNLKKVARLQAFIKVLEDRLRKKRIYAPVSGFVVKRHAEVGQWLDKGDPVVTLVVLDPIRVLVPIPERHISSIQLGEKALVMFDAFPERRFEGVIKAIIPKANEAARTFPVRLQVPNPNGAIKGGMLGRVTLPTGSPYNAVILPKDALVLSGKGAVVFVIDGQKARPVEVKAGEAHDDYIEVTGDIQPGSVVAVRGNERLYPGQSVKILDKDEP